jgi:hypothetical protein
MAASRFQPSYTTAKMAKPMGLDGLLMKVDGDAVR